MRRTLALLALLALAGLWVGCGGGDNTNGTNSNMTVNSANITVQNANTGATTSTVSNTNTTTTATNTNTTTTHNTNAPNTNHSTTNTNTGANHNAGNGNMTRITTNTNTTTTRNTNHEYPDTCSSESEARCRLARLSFYRNGLSFAPRKMAADVTTFRYLTDAGDAARAFDAFRGESLISLDTETFWGTKDTKSGVSLVQACAPGGEVIVVDAMATGIDPVRAVVEDSGVSMAAHNARFDQGVLRGEGLNPTSFVDTLSLARSALTLGSYSLASVTEHLFGIPLDKSLQSSNWRRRPLTRAQLEYAARDAYVTLLVYEELKRRLGAEGRWEEALRAATLPDERTAATKTRRRRAPAPPGPPLTPEEKRAVELLKKWRLQRANTQRVPAYMICPDKTLECLARERPESVEALRSIYGLGDSKITNFGEELLAALRDALG